MYCAIALRPILPHQRLHHPHRAAPIPASEHSPVVEMVVELVQLDAIVVLVHRLRLGTKAVVLVHEGRSKAAEHLHVAKLVLAVGVNGGRVVCDAFRIAACVTDGAGARVATPEIAVHDNRGDAFTVVEVLVAEESGDDFGCCGFYEAVEFAVFALRFLAAAQDEAEAVLSIEVGPACFEAVVLRGVAAAGRHRESEHGFVVALGDGRWRVVEFCKLGCQRGSF